MINLLIRSLWNRRSTAVLTIFSISISVTLLLGVENIRQGVRGSFSSAVSGTDIIVGARGGSLQLLLYSIFRIGNAPNNLSWESYNDFLNDKRIKWTIPISLGDSHRGYRVLGTNQDYFKYFRYGSKKKLEFAKGESFSKIFDAVIGSEVAIKFNYKVNEKIIIAHGTGKKSFLKHDDRPFKVVGILKPTGTPVDQSLHVSLEGITAMHIDWESGAPPMEGESLSTEDIMRLDLKTEAITSFLIGLKSKIHAFSLQREINSFKEEPLSAIMPGVALQELWTLLRTAEIGLRVVTWFVLFAGLLGMMTSLLSGLNERRREMAILRSVGAGPGTISFLLIFEATFLSLAGILFGLLLLYITLFVSQPLLEAYFGLFIPINPPSFKDLIILGVIILTGMLMGLIPALRAYRQSLADGMTIRL
jgi:putative ABC transport system permease protein|tara:strand:- start:152 stop:1408 length:1257 start_codon:yes stop_codon:yes gene_type:complete